MAVPGFSVSELIRAVDKSAKLIAALQEAPKVLENVITRVEFGRDILEAWKEEIEQNPDTVHKKGFQLLVRVKTDYESVLTELEAFIRKHRRLPNGGLGARIRWVISKEFLNERAGLETKLKELEGRINTVLGTLNLRTNRSNRQAIEHAIEEILRRTSTGGFAQQGLESPAAPQICHSPELLPQASRSSTSRALSEQAVQLPPALVSENVGQDASNQAVEASPDVGRRQSWQPSSSGRSLESDSIRVRGASASTLGTVSYASSTFSTSTSSSTATDYSQVDTIRRSISSHDNNAAGSTSSVRLGPSRSNSSSLAVTVIASPGSPTLSRALSHPTIGTMPIEGEIKILYKNEKGRIHRILRSLDIATSSGRGASEVRMTTDRGIAIVHRGSPHRTDLAKGILPLPSDTVKYYRDVDLSIRYVVKVRGHYELYRPKERDVIFTGSPDYSFTNERDYKNFQTMLKGKINLLNVETQTISTSGDDKVSDSQILQVWEKDGTRTIRFFRNASDNKFSEYESGGLTQYSSKKNELKLEFKPGHDPDNFKKLKIIFQTEAGKNECMRLTPFSNG